MYDPRDVADVHVLISQAGPLPIKATAEIECDGPAVLTLAGSVWSRTANGPHTFALEPLTPQTTSDFNDRFVLTVQY